jgi:ADP-ribosylglycohydrolase
MGVAIGDALGMPVETMSHEAVMALNGGQGVTGFMDPVLRTDWVAPAWSSGSTADDFQLTIAVANACIAARGFDLGFQREEHIQVYLNEGTYGWGGTTLRAIAALAEGRAPEDAPPVGSGRGNGVIMKIAPIAITHLVTGAGNYDLLSWCVGLGMMTHRDPRASLAAYAVARLIRWNILNGPVQGNARTEVRRIIKSLKDIESRMGISADKVSEKLLIALDYEDAPRLRTNAGTHGDALATVAFSIGTYLRHRNDFRSAVLGAVNAGGDTDTNASVVGALVGAGVGLKGIPAEWQNFRKEYKEALRLGEELLALG